MRPHAAATVTSTLFGRPSFGDSGCVTGGAAFSETLRSLLAISAVNADGLLPFQVSISMVSATRTSTPEPGVALSSNTRPTGRIRRPTIFCSSRAWRASLASPDRKGSRPVSLWLFPSGKINTAPRFLRVIRISRNALLLREASCAAPLALRTSSLTRRSGTTPTILNSAATSGLSTRVAFAVIVIGRGMTQAAIKESTRAF